eukprot:GHVT01021274.1.p1 GENE.GHVT01021274.1~~GHVT01021274.1.p1  ORF type:complete len:149 (+),score=19.79 GHVT01021274.1:513-959(+)
MDELTDTINSSPTREGRTVFYLTEGNALLVHHFMPSKAEWAIVVTSQDGYAKLKQGQGVALIKTGTVHFPDGDGDMFNAISSAITVTHGPRVARSDTDLCLRRDLQEFTNQQLDSHSGATPAQSIGGTFHQILAGVATAAVVVLNCVL